MMDVIVGGANDHGLPNDLDTLRNNDRINIITTTNDATNNTKEFDIVQQQSETNNNNEQGEASVIVEQEGGEGGVEGEKEQKELYLESEWEFYYDEGVPKGMSCDDYQSYIKSLGSFNSVQGFWRYWNNIMDVSLFPIGANLRLFKSGIAPTWEDPANANGGKWSLLCTKEQSSNIVMRTILTLIGEQIEYGPDICGFVLSVRPNRHIVSVWNKNSENQEVIDKTSQDLSNFILGRVFKYTSHKQAMATASQQQLSSSSSSSSLITPPPSPNTSSNNIRNSFSNNSHHNTPRLVRENSLTNSFNQANNTSNQQQQQNQNQTRQKQKEAFTQKKSISTSSLVSTPTSSSRKNNNNTNNNDSSRKITTGSHSKYSLVVDSSSELIPLPQSFSSVQTTTTTSKSHPNLTFVTTTTTTTSAIPSPQECSLLSSPEVITLEGQSIDITTFTPNLMNSTCSIETILCGHNNSHGNHLLLSLGKDDLDGSKGNDSILSVVEKINNVLNNQNSSSINQNNNDLFDLSSEKTTPSISLSSSLSNTEIPSPPTSSSPPIIIENGKSLDDLPINNNNNNNNNDNSNINDSNNQLKTPSKLTQRNTPPTPKSQHKTSHHHHGSNKYKSNHKGGSAVSKQRHSKGTMAMLKDNYLILVMIFSGMIPLLVFLLHY